MIELIRKTTQTTYTFAVKEDTKEYIVTFIFNDADKRMISHNVSLDGERLDWEQEDDISDKVIAAYPEGFPK
jgi:hypothetical protein